MNSSIKKSTDKDYSDINLKNIEFLDFDDDIESLDFDDNIETLDFDNNKTNFTMMLNPDENNNIEVLEFELTFKNNNNEKIDVLEFDTVEVETLDFELEDIINNGEDALIIEQKSFDKENKDDLSIATTVTKKEKVKKKENQKQALIFLLIIMLAALTFVIYKIINWNLQNNSINSQIEEINEIATVTEVKDEKNAVIIDESEPIIDENLDDDNKEVYIDRNNDYYRYINEPLIDVDFTNLLAKNGDTAGWIQVSGTNINYPIVQTDNNEYYLTHAFDGSYNEAGWIFADYRNNFIDDRNLIIYGHARLNSTMFGTLKNVVKSYWYTDKDNYVVKISTPSVNSSWQVFSTYAIDPEDYYIKTYFEDDDSFLEFAKILKARSVYDYNVELKPTDRILTLSTCYSNNQRIVLHAKLIKYENKE